MFWAKGWWAHRLCIHIWNRPKLMTYVNFLTVFCRFPQNVNLTALTKHQFDVWGLSVMWYRPIETTFDEHIGSLARFFHLCSWMFIWSSIYLTVKNTNLTERWVKSKNNELKQNCTDNNLQYHHSFPLNQADGANIFLMYIHRIFSYIFVH